MQGSSEIITNSCRGPAYNLVMRIIAGTLKGREVRAPRSSRVRPATGLVREMAMSLLGDRLTSAPFLDLCAGTGLIGFEALSRGAPHVVFVEADGRHAGQLRRTAHELGVAARSTVLRLDVRRCFKALRKHLDGSRAACAFLDPPFIEGMAAEMLVHFGREASVLRPDGLLIVRAPERLPVEVAGLKFQDHRRAGQSWLGVYAPAGEPEMEEHRAGQ